LTLYSDKYIVRDTAAKQISVSCNFFFVWHFIAWLEYKSHWNS